MGRRRSAPELALSNVEDSLGDSSGLGTHTKDVEICGHVRRNVETLAILQEAFFFFFLLGQFPFHLRLSREQEKEEAQEVVVMKMVMVVVDLGIGVGKREKEATN